MLFLFRKIVSLALEELTYMYNEDIRNRLQCIFGRDICSLGMDVTRSGLHFQNGERVDVSIIEVMIHFYVKVLLQLKSATHSWIQVPDILQRDVTGCRKTILVFWVP